MTNLSITLFIPFLFLPFLAIAAGTVATLAAIAIKYFAEDAKSLVVLGLQGTGKTRWLSYLRGVKYLARGTKGMEPYPNFIFTRRNGEIITVKSGYDIGGGAANVTNYQKLLDGEEPKVVMFFFDMKRFLDNEAYHDHSANTTYRQEVVSRLNLIREHFADKLPSDSIASRVYIMMSFADKVSDRTKAYEQVKDILVSEYGLSFINSASVYPINASSTTELEEFKNKIKL